MQLIDYKMNINTNTFQTLTQKRMPKYDVTLTSISVINMTLSNKAILKFFKKKIIKKKMKRKLCHSTYFQVLQLVSLSHCSKKDEPGLIEPLLWKPGSDNIVRFFNWYLVHLICSENLLFGSCHALGIASLLLYFIFFHFSSTTLFR